MRGRLPEIRSELPPPTPTPKTIHTIATTICPEHAYLQDLEREAEDHLIRVLAYTPTPTPTYVLTLREQRDLTEVALIVSKDMQKLQAGLGLYAIGTSVQVSVLGKDHIVRYMDMALTLAHKAFEVLQVAASAMMDKIKEYEQRTGLDASEELYKQTELAVSEAKLSFRRGMKRYPFAPGTESARCKAQEWSKISNMMESFTKIQRDLQDRKTWALQTIDLLEGALSEDRRPALDYLSRISNTHLDLALWIYDHPEDRPLLVPKKTSLFLDMQRSAVTAFHVAKRVLDRCEDEDDLEPKHYYQVVDCLYLMTLICVSPDLVHAYSREAAQWVQLLGNKFPKHRVDPEYLNASRKMAAKDKVMQAIREYRQQRRESQPA
ncbi:hypothetical protein BGZ83_005813 [Gryganskiella cystojenkinii]|nr:hypothetical protein BGZ83_005813 [Gryganskiella cystojenkinii]